MDMTDLLSMGTGRLVLLAAGLAVVVLAVSVLIWAALLWAAARIVPVKDVSFGRALASAIFLDIVWVAMVGGVALLFVMRADAVWPPVMAVWLAELLSPIAAVELLRSGFKTTRPKAFVVLCTAGGLGSLVLLYGTALVMLVLVVLGRPWSGAVPGA